jgi:hypothetical protein
MTSREALAILISVLAGLVAFDGAYGWATLWILIAIGVSR